MRIVMMTNTYLPHVGGVARSVESFSTGLRELGHNVMVVAPEFPGMPEKETDVVRVPAIQRFNGSDFSVRLPVPGLLTDPLERFQPEIIHAHHPFLLGDTALRVASGRGIPLVFTHHTLYEEYTHYVSSESDAIKRFVIDLSTGYANLCDHVIAPSESVSALLQQRGVTVPITVVPTGVDVDRFGRRSGKKFRNTQGIPEEAFVVGHIGRLAPEKNLMFLTRSVAAFLKARPEAWFLVAGTGPLEEEMKELFGSEGVLDRVRFPGILKGRDLVNAYASMDVFAFASKSETQGIVLVEAMAAGAPVVAVDASGVREVVRDGVNGRKLSIEDQDTFSSALAWVADLPPEARKTLTRNARKTARGLSNAVSSERLASVYASVIKKKAAWDVPEEGLWQSAMRRIQAEWRLLGTIAHAAGTALVGAEATMEGKSA
ncbi:MAG: glycosyl transferase group 1 [Fibrobacteres bacterium]|nr:glycosyl transferase group 1 [Fibrobacterota bacterium]